MLCLSGFELYSRWEPLINSLHHHHHNSIPSTSSSFPGAHVAVFNNRRAKTIEKWWQWWWQEIKLAYLRNVLVVLGEMWVGAFSVVKLNQQMNVPPKSTNQNGHIINPILLNLVKTVILKTTKRRLGYHPPSIWSTCDKTQKVLQCNIIPGAKIGVKDSYHTTQYIQFFTCSSSHILLQLSPTFEQMSSQRRTQLYWVRNNDSTTIGPERSSLSFLKG